MMTDSAALGHAGCGASRTGGRMTVNGTVTGTMNAAAGTASLAPDGTETIAAYQFVSSGVTYTITAAPDLVVKGTLVINERGSAPNMRLTLTGSFTISRGGIANTCPLSGVIQPNAVNGETEMSGTICGDRVRRDM